MTNHPEQLDGEVFIGNSEPGRFESRTYLSGISYREGKQAYDIHGKADRMEGYAPIFVSSRDYARYDKIMTDRVTRH